MNASRFANRSGPVGGAALTGLPTDGDGGRVPADAPAVAAAVGGTDDARAGAQAARNAAVPASAAPCRKRRRVRSPSARLGRSVIAGSIVPDPGRLALITVVTDLDVPLGSSGQSGYDIDVSCVRTRSPSAYDRHHRRG